MSDVTTVENPNGTTTEVECTGCDWNQPASRSVDHGTPERPGCADYCDATMPLIGAHIDATGHHVRVTLTTHWLDRDDEQSGLLILPRVPDDTGTADRQQRAAERTTTP